MWSTVAARELGLLTLSDARDRCGRLLSALDTLPRHPPTGLYFNWYDAARAALPARAPKHWPSPPFVSSIDNGWLAAALLLLAAVEPTLADRAHSRLESMDFDVFDGPGTTAGGSQPLHGGFWLRGTRRPTVTSSPLSDGSRVHLTPHCYDMLNSETRLTELVLIALRRRTPSLAHLHQPIRSLFDTDVVATWGGSMFEALAPAVLVPETEWAPATWGLNHARTADLHRRHGARLGGDAWGFSPALRPGGRYAEFGVAEIAAGPGYPSGFRGTLVVTPHASALALELAPESAYENLARLADLPGCYGPGGFVDAVALARRPRATDRHLLIDQAMLLGGLVNVLADGVLRAGFSAPSVREPVRTAVCCAPWPVPTDSQPPETHRGPAPTGEPGLG